MYQFSVISWTVLYIGKYGGQLVSQVRNSGQFQSAVIVHYFNLAAWTVRCLVTFLLNLSKDFHATVKAQSSTFYKQSIFKTMQLLFLKACAGFILLVRTLMEGFFFSLWARQTAWLLLPTALSNSRQNNLLDSSVYKYFVV